MTFLPDSPKNCADTPRPIRLDAINRRTDLL